MNIKELRQRKADLLTEAKTLSDKENDGTISEEETARLNAVVDEVMDHFRPGTVLTATSDPAVTVRLVAVADAPAVPGVDRYTVPVSVRYRAARVH